MSTEAPEPFRKTESSKDSISDRLIATKPVGWETATREKFLAQSNRDRGGEGGLLASQPPLCISDPYQSAGKHNLTNPRFNGVQFKTAHEKSGRNGLFHLETSCGLGAKYEPVELCMLRFHREAQRSKGPVEHSRVFLPSGQTRRPHEDKDVFLLEVDATMPADLSRTKISEREEERMCRVNYYKTAPCLPPNCKTNPPKKGTYGYLGTALNKFPETMTEPFDLYDQKQKEERLNHDKLMAGRPPFVQLPFTKPEGTFTVTKEVYGTDVVFPDKIKETKAPITTPWRYNNPQKSGGPGYPKITIEPYPTHFEPNRKDNLPPIKRIEVPFHGAGNPHSKPAPSIRLNMTNIRRRTK